MLQCGATCCSCLLQLLGPVHRGERRSSLGGVREAWGNGVGKPRLCVQQALARAFGRERGGPSRRPGASAADLFV